MAKDKRPLSGKSVDLDIFDLDKLDDEFGSDFGIDKQKGPVGRFFTGFKRGFLEQSKNKAALGRAIHSALPDGYGRAISTVLGAKSSVRSIVDEVKRNNASDLGELTRSAETMLPKLRGRTSERLYSRIEDRLRRTREELDALSRSAVTPEQLQEAEDNAVLANLLANQGELQRDLAAAKEASDQERFERERLERSLSDKLTSLRFGDLSRQMGIVGSLLHRQVDYQDQVTYQFQRKSLEIQYRQLFMLRDLRKYAEVTLDVHKRAYDVLAHNTSIPDFRKGKESEKTYFRPGQRLAMGAASNLGEFLANFYPTIRDNIAGRASETVGTLSSMLSMAAGGIPSGIDKLDLGGQVLGSGAANQLLTRLAVMARGPLEKTADKLTGGKQFQLSYLLKNMPSLLRDYTTDLGQSGGWRGAIQSMVRSVVPTYFQDDTLEDGTYQSIDRAASFNHLTQRSIVEVIPGYLSRILHEARISRTGDPNTEREVYDITAGKFTGYSEAKRRLLGRLIPETQRRNVNDALEAFLNSSDVGGTLSPEAREALRERLLRDAASGGRFDPKNYRAGGYAAETADSTLQELQQFFQGQFSFDEKGNLIGNRDNLKRREELSDLFLSLQSVVPDVRGELKRITGAGSQELIRDLGLVVNQFGTDRIDYDRIWKQYRGDTTGGGEVSLLASDLTRDPEGREVVLQATKVQAGEYVDQPTGKVIQTVDDITGDIKDRMGRLVATGSELGNGLYDRAGKKVIFHNLKERFKAAISGINDLRRRLQETAMNALRSVGDTLQDVYTAGGRRIALLARDIRNGEYIDVNTDKVIQNISDITGEVRDSLGNVVLTAAEFAEGLVNNAGEKIKGEEGPGFWNRYLRVTTAPMRAISGVIGRAVKRVAGWLWGKMTRPRDAYMPGETEPRLKANLLKTGFYIDDETQTPITEFYQIKGSVSDINGNQVISAEELPQLIYRDGAKHEVAKRPGLLRRMARGYWRFTKNYYKWLGKTSLKAGGKLLRGAGSLLGKLFGKGKKVEPKDIETPTDGLLYRIMNVLDERLPGKALRSGSWQDILARRAKGKKGAEEKDDDDETTGKGPLASLMGGLKKLFGQGGDEEDEDDGDTYIGYEGGEGDGKDGKKKRGKKGRKKGLRGKLGRLAGKGKGLLGKAGGLLGKGLGLAGVAYGGYSAYDNLTKGNYGGAALDAGLAAGGLALSTGGLAGLTGALGTAAAAIGSVISLPVVLAGAAVAGGVYLGYKYYQKRKRASGLFREFRLAQYGVAPGGWTEPGKLLDLEAMMAQAVTFSGPTPTIDKTRMPYKDIIALFDVDDRDVDHVTHLVAWLDQRFKPVFLSYHATLKALTPDILLEDLDDKLPEELGMQFLERVKYPYTGSTPYAIMVSPFSGEKMLEVDMDFIRMKEKAIVERYQGKAKAGEKGQNGKPMDWKTMGMAAGTTALNNTQVVKPGIVGRGTPGQQMSVLDAALGKSSDVFEIASSTKAVELYNRPLTGLETIRLKAYGLTTLTQGSVRDVFALENYVMQQMRMDGQGQAVFSGSIDDLIKQFSTSFAVGASGSERYAEFTNWLRLRFLPVAVNYASGVNRVIANAPLSHSQGRLERLMDPVMKVSVAKAVIGATVEDKGAKVSVWTISYGPNGIITGGLTDLETSARAHLKLLESEADNYELKTAIDAAKTQSTGTTGTTSMVTGRQSPGSTGRAGTTSGGVVLPLPRVPSPLQRGGVNVALGNVFTGVQTGTGGAWESIPFPVSNGTLGGALPTLQAVAKMTGVDLGMLVTICSIESGFNYLVRAKTSSATGWFQFIDNTWDDVYKRYAALYQLPSSDPGRSLRNDPRVNALMGAEFLKANYKVLESGLKRKPTDTDIYLAHFLGAGTAVKFLKTDVNAIAAQAFPQQAKANQSIFFHPGGQARTIGEVYRLMDEKVNRHRYGGSFNIQSSANDDVSMAAANDAAYTAPSGQPMKDDAPKATAKQLFGLQSAGSLASTTSRPLNPTAPATVAPDRSGSDSITQATPDVVNEQQLQVLQTARANDRRQQQQVEESMAASREIHGIMEKQLAVQETMRDYLREIAGKIGVGSLTDTPNPTTRASADRVHRAGGTPPPVSMKHSR